MISEKKLLEIINYIKENTSSYFAEQIQKNMKNFDYSLFKNAYEIIKNKDTYSKEKWLELANEYKDEYKMMLVILKNSGENLPDDVYYDLLQTIKNNKSDPTRSSFNSEIETELVYECLKKELSGITLEKLLEVESLSLLNSHFFEYNNYYTTSELCKDKSLLVNQENTKKIAIYSAIKCKEKMEHDLKVIREREEEAIRLGKPPLSLSQKVIDQRTIEARLRSLSCIRYIQDIDFLSDLMNDFSSTAASELIAASIIDNVFLDHNDPKIKDFLLEILGDCNICILNTYPKCIAQEISLIAYYPLVNFLDDTCKLTQWGLVEHPTTKVPIEPNKLKQIIEDISSRDLLDPAVQTDLAHRIAKGKSKTEDYFAITFFSNISNPDLLPLIDELCSHNKIKVYENNPHIPPEMAIKRAEEFCKKIDNLIFKNQERKISDNWYHYIFQMAKKTTLSDMCYNTILNSFNRINFVSDIATLPTTPESVIDAIISFCDNDENKKQYSYLDKTRMIAKVNKFTKTGEFDETIATALYRAINSSFFYLKEDSSIKEFLKGSIYYNIQGIHSLYKYHPKQAKILEDCFNKYLQDGYFTPREEIFAKRIIDILNDGLINKAQIQKEKETNAFKLETLCKSIRQSLDADFIYAEVPPVIDKISECYDNYLKELEEIKLEEKEQELQQ